MDEHGECEHTGGILDPAHCTFCIEGPTLPKRKKAKKARRKKVRPRRVAAPDPAAVLIAEYLSGMRCMKCDALRTGNAMQCRCERLEILDSRIDGIAEWAAKHPDSKLAQTAAAAGITRATLRAGVRWEPSGIDGLSRGGALGLLRRLGQGQNIEWRRDTRSGDPMPV